MDGGARGCHWHELKYKYRFLEVVIPTTHGLGLLQTDVQFPLLDRVPGLLVVFFTVLFSISVLGSFPFHIRPNVQITRGHPLRRQSLRLSQDYNGTKHN